MTNDDDNDADDDDDGDEDEDDDDDDGDGDDVDDDDVKADVTWSSFNNLLSLTVWLFNSHHTTTHTRHVRDNRLLITLRPYYGTLLAPLFRLILCVPCVFQGSAGNETKSEG